MEDLRFSLFVVLPLILLMLVGYFLQRINIFTKDFSTQCNRVCFEVFLPCLIFYNIYTNEAGSKGEMGAVVYCIIASVVLIAVLLVTVPFIIKDRSKTGVMIQGMFKSNSLIFGIPLAGNLYGPSGTGIITIIVSAMVPLYNFASVIVLSIFDPQKEMNRSMVWEVVKDIIKNPLIVSSIVALTVNYIGLHIPEFIMSTVGSLSAIGTPLALISLGASFQLKSLSGNMKCLFRANIFKMIIMPATIIGVAVYLGYREVELAAILALFASPIAVSSYIMAQRSRGDHDLAGQLVVMSNLFSIFTIFMLIYALKVMQYL